MTFDPEEFMQTSITGANDTHYVPIPEGDYVALVDQVMPPRVTDEGRVYMHIVWNIDSDNLRKSMDRDKVTTRQTLWLDIDESGHLDRGKGKNVPLGRVREALGLNTADSEFKPPMMVGRPAQIRVTQRLDKDTKEIFNDVKAVTAIT